MSDLKQWQVSGNAPQAYERYMVPTLFTPWAQGSWPAPPCRWGTCAGCRLWDRDRCATRDATGRPLGVRYGG